MLVDVTCAPRAVDAPPTVGSTAVVEEWSLSTKGQRSVFGPGQPLAIVGSSECCDFRLPNLPPVACVFYNCGSKILVCDLTGRTSKPAVSFRSNASLPLRGHQLELEFSPRAPDTKTESWPEIAFCWGGSSHLRLMNTEMTTIGSDYPSRYRLRGSSLSTCHAAIIWHNSALHLLDLTETYRVKRTHRLQRIQLGQVRVCNEIGIRFCSVVDGERPSEVATKNPVDFCLQERRQTIESINAKIVQQITTRSLKNRDFRKVFLGLLMTPVIAMAGVFCYRLMNLLMPYL